MSGHLGNRFAQIVNGSEFVSGSMESVSEGAEKSRVLIVDAALPGVDVLLGGVQSGVKVVSVEQGDNAVEVIEETFRSQKGSEVHILTHGAPGKIYFGSQAIGKEVFEKILGEDAQSKTSIVFYGSNVARGEEGRSFVSQIASATGASVVASERKVGSSRLGGDWDLKEFGKPTWSPVFSAAAMNRYEHVLMPDYASVADAEAVYTAPGGYTISDTAENLASGTADVMNGADSVTATTDATVAQAIIIDGFTGGGGGALFDQRRSRENHR
ncbi:hypothetical protein CCP2SC5_1110001 [Azospirillaceae bacterium]